MSIKPGRGVEDLQLRNALARPLGGKRHSQAEMADAGNRDLAYGEGKMSQKEYARNRFKSKRGSVDLADGQPDPMVGSAERSVRHTPSKVGDFAGYDGGSNYNTIDKPSRSGRDEYEQNFNKFRKPDAPLNTAEQRLVLQQDPYALEEVRYFDRLKRSQMQQNVAYKNYERNFKLPEI
jgi:hypothetical protein